MCEMSSRNIDAQSDRGKKKHCSIYFNCAATGPNHYSAFKLGPGAPLRMILKNRKIKRVTVHYIAMETHFSPSSVS